MTSDCDSSSNDEANYIEYQLTQFGYEKEEIIQAIKAVNNKNDINEIMSEIDTQNEKKSNTKITNDHKIKSKKKKIDQAKEILCLYPSDTYTNKSASDSSKLYLRTSPYTSAPTHNKYSRKMNQFLKHDIKNNIYYFPIGVSGSKLQFKTSNFTWPKKYTILMWVRWKQGGTITTFDSDSYTPIYGSNKRLGCAAGFSWKTVDNYKMIYSKWQCVVVFGGDNMSRFYIGDLLNEPESIGHVACDIGGHQTWRIGNSYQGPGDVGCIIVFDNHKSMQSLIQLYHESILIMGNYWNQTEVEMIKKMLMQYIQIDGIVLIIFQLILGRLIGQFSL
eukprot:298126_1